MKRPFESVIEGMSESLLVSKQNLRFNYEQADKLLIWIIGFSIAGFYFITSSLSAIKEVYDFQTLKIIFYLLGLSIVAGIIARLSFFINQIYAQQIEIFISEAFSNRELMETEPTEIGDIKDIREIIRLLKVDFGEDYSNLIHDKDLNDLLLIEPLLKDLKIRYKEIGAWAKKDYENALWYVDDTLKKAYGYSDKKLDKIKTDNTALKWNISLYFYSISFMISCITFLSVIIILCVNFVKLDGTI